MRVKTSGFGGINIHNKQFSSFSLQNLMVAENVMFLILSNTKGIEILLTDIKFVDEINC